MKTKFLSVFKRLPQIKIAPKGAWYSEIDYDGDPTGIWVSAGEGDRLPIISPQGYTWRLAYETDADRVRFWFSTFYESAFDRRMNPRSPLVPLDIAGRRRLASR